jgi:hypothetical protein
LETLIAVDKDVAEAVFGWRPGRPTISRRVGTVVGNALGVGAAAGTAIFHAALWILAFVFFVVVVVPWLAKNL